LYSKNAQKANSLTKSNSQIELRKSQAKNEKRRVFTKAPGQGKTFLKYVMYRQGSE